MLEQRGSQCQAGSVICNWLRAGGLLIFSPHDAIEVQSNMFFFCKTQKGNGEKSHTKQNHIRKWTPQGLKSADYQPWAEVTCQNYWEHTTTSRQVCAEWRTSINFPVRLCPLRGQNMSKPLHTLVARSCCFIFRIRQFVLLLASSSELQYSG